VRRWRFGAALVVAIVGTASTGSVPALAHHSFAMYDQTTTKTLTGKLTRFVVGGNHSQLIFEVLGDDGKTTVDQKTGKTMMWQVETGSATAIARQGITVAGFPIGTIFTVTFYPLRDGRPQGAVAGPLIKCGATFPAGGCNKDTGQLMTVPAN
jgi:Family of unknown function (DUF6152)